MFSIWVKNFESKIFSEFKLNNQVYRQKDRQINRQIERQINRQINKQTDRQIDRQMIALNNFYLCERIDKTC